ncbi:unnamed protein product [Psylliodes chrysocephalus]|uniref:Uncharacterized protein n=1 Tax=Psylliodes chrysocephalus TaxID=3402493 RepID=A0A9P0GKJ8_9CUCU|nr:unnamed protein product [Psylliodes chrysocephala]
MNVRCVFLIVIYIFVLISVESQHRRKCNEKINVVLFFTESSKVPISDLGIRFLQLYKVVEVEHNAEADKNHDFISKRRAERCKDNLKESLDSLTLFCKNALGMNTAIVTISSSSITEDIKETNSKKLPKLRKSRKRKKNIPGITKATKVTKPSTKEIILSPQHTEVFKIRVKRNTTNEQNETDINYRYTNNNQFIGAPVDKDRMEHPWDSLDVWSHVRFSFFGDLFKDKKKENLSKQENDILTNGMVNRENDRGLFETVESTLKNLQENPEAFLMVVFGGELQEVSDKYSPLVQTLKHVIENTDPENTLIVLTGNCPEFKNPNNGVVEINENVKECRNLNKIPVYAKGPKSDKLGECVLLYDIPLIIKNSLEESSPIFDGNH